MQVVMLIFETIVGTKSKKFQFPNNSFNYIFLTTPENTITPLASVIVNPNALSIT